MKPSRVCNSLKSYKTVQNRNLLETHLFNDSVKIRAVSTLICYGLCLFGRGSEQTIK